MEKRKGKGRRKERDKEKRQKKEERKEKKTMTETKKKRKKEKRKFKKTNELVLPPKNWKRISSTNSVVRKDKSSLKLSTSADSSDDVFSVSTLTCRNKGIRQFSC